MVFHGFPYQPPLYSILPPPPPPYVPPYLTLIRLIMGPIGFWEVLEALEGLARVSFQASMSLHFWLRKLQGVGCSKPLGGCDQSDTVAVF